MTEKTPMHRRDFLEKAAVVGGIAATLPAASWARLSGANEAIRLGVIGCGPRGQSLAKEFRLRGDERQLKVTRISDVWQPRLKGTTELLGLPLNAGTMEYREIIDDPEIDAVLIATPDHWHAKMSIDALEAGKAVLVETPLSHTIEQAIAIRDTVARTRGTFAVAAQRCSRDVYWQLRQAIAEQRIGRITWSQGSFTVNGRIPIFATPKAGAVSARVGSDSPSARPSPRIGSSGTRSTTSTATGSPERCSSAYSRPCCWRSRAHAASSRGVSCPAAASTTTSMDGRPRTSCSRCWTSPESTPS